MCHWPNVLLVRFFLPSPTCATVSPQPVSVPPNQSTQSETTSAVATADSLNLPTVPLDTSPSAITTPPSTSETGQPRNISIEKMAQGWVVSWLPPSQLENQVAYYTVQHKEGDGEWIMSESISQDNAYLSMLCLILN